jgi:hypothetical protein
MLTVKEWQNHLAKTEMCSLSFPSSKSHVGIQAIIIIYLFFLVVVLEFEFRGFVLARKMLYGLSHAFSSFCSGYF